jgi:hypothetical protein
MINSKLILLLKSFKKKEMKAFELFINSPLFNKNADVINLLSILKKSDPQFDSKTLTHAKMSHMLFKKIDVTKFRYVMTDLTKLLERFIAYQSYLEEEDDFLIKAYQSRGLNKYFKQASNNKYLKLTNDSNIRDDNYFQHLYNLNELSYRYTSEHDNRNIDTELQSLVDNLDVSFLSKKLKYSCEIINRMNILKVEYDIKLLNYLLEYVEKNEVKNTPSIRIYYQILLTLNEPDNEAHYFALKKLLYENLQCFKKDEQYDMYGYLQNYCIKKVNTGNDDYLKKLFETYKEMIEEKVVVKRDSIAQFDFKNIVTVALRVGEYDWTDNFITENQKYLLSEHRINAVNYNKARLCFYLKKYKEGLTQLLSVEFTDIYYSLDSRVLLLKTYYELEDLESAMSLISAFKIYLKRDSTISKYQNLTYFNFLKIINQLVRIKMGYKNDIKKIEDILNKTKQVADLTWLKHKIKEFV